MKYIVSIREHSEDGTFRFSRWTDPIEAVDEAEALHKAAQLYESDKIVVHKVKG